jgi:hypothetical protein
MGTACVGEVKGAASLGLLSPHQSLVFEQLESRIDRSRAGLPDPAAALVDLVDELVSIEWALGQQDEQRSSDVTASSPASAKPAAP